MHPVLGGWMWTIEASYNKHGKTQHKRHYAKVRSVYNELDTYYHSHRHEESRRTWVGERTLLLHLHWNRWQAKIDTYIKDRVNKRTAIETLRVSRTTFLATRRIHVCCCATFIRQNCYTQLSQATCAFFCKAMGFCDKNAYCSLRLTQNRAQKLVYISWISGPYVVVRNPATAVSEIHDLSNFILFVIYISWISSQGTNTGRLRSFVAAS